MARRQTAVLAELRGRIVRGEIAPGALMPSRLALAEAFDVSGVTLQRVFDRLRADGLIEARPRAGTFVKAEPPFLTDYALVFMREPGGEGWSRFYQALHDSALKARETRGKTVRCYFNVDMDPQTGDYRRLAADSEAHRIAGQIFTTFSAPVASPDFRPDEIPGAVIALTGAPRPAGRAAIELDYPALWTRAAEHMAARGRRRVAVLHESHTPDADPDPVLLRIFAAHGLTMPPAATIMLHPYARQGAVSWVQLLMKAERGVRPDALFIGDDNFTEPVLKGLVQAGVRVPEDLLVVAHNNFPLPVPDVLPITLVGFNAETILNAAMSHIDRRRRGQRTPAVVRIAPEFRSDEAAPATVVRPSPRHRRPVRARHQPARRR